MLLQPTNPMDNHWCSHEHVINVSPVGQKDNSLQHQDKSLVSLAPAMVWGSCNPWHSFIPIPSCSSYRFLGNPAECLSFPVTLYIGHEKLQPPGFHLVCNWLKKKEGKLADFFQKEKKHSWNNWQEKKLTSKSDKITKAPFQLLFISLRLVILWSLLCTAMQNMHHLQSQKGIYSNVCYHLPLVLISSLCSINLLCFMFQNGVKYLSRQFNIYLPKVNKRSLKTYIRYVLSF